MLLSPLHKLIDKLYTFRFYLLFITMVLNFFVPTFLLHPLIMTGFKIFTAVCLMLAGANFIQRDKIILRNAWFFLGSVIIAILTFTNIYPEHMPTEIVQYWLLYLFFIVITINLLQQIFSIKEVTADVILGSFCGYLLIGINSWFLFVLTEIIIPNSYSGLSSDFVTKINELFYFAFTCLTTLGFGDILPTNMLSQKLSVFAAAVGQFYIAVVVAILVSRLLNTKHKS